MNKLDMESKDIVNENIEKISKIFPNVIVESERGKSIDFELLKQELSKEIVEGNKEKYQLTWPGKKEAIVNANTHTNKTLRPIKEKSVDFENTENIYIEGDNLEVLKILQESYLNKIKCIYIDPPYNTGNDFIYHDNFNKDTINELEESGQIDEYNNRLVTNSESNGRYHSDWLSMMFSRIKISKNLLSDEGVILLSINDCELVNLRKICDEIFGEKNLVAQLIRKGTGGRQDSKYYAVIHEYVLIYAKDINKFNAGKEVKENDNSYNLTDENGRKYKLQLLRKWGENSKRSDRPNLYYPILDPDGNAYYPMISETEEGRWRWGKETMINNIELGKVEWKKKENYWIPYEKIYKPMEEENTKVYSTIIEDIGTSSGASYLKELFKQKLFDYPKPYEFIIKLLKMVDIKSNEIVMDFFSGSATTADAVMRLNSSDNGKRKFIMVQLPEKCDSKSDAFEFGYNTIFDIGKERIYRASKKIKEKTNANIDYGFRVYKVDSSNMKDVYYLPNEIKQEQLGMFESNIKEDRTAEDLLTQVILDLGLTLDLKIEEKNILNNKVYFVDENSLVACFDKDINLNIIDEICKCNPLKVVFKDDSFKYDNDKINLQERLKKISPNTEVSII